MRYDDVVFWVIGKVAFGLWCTGTVLSQSKQFENGGFAGNDGCWFAGTVRQVLWSGG